MKRLILFTLLITSAYIIKAQVNREVFLQELEKSNYSDDNSAIEATTTASTRLFGDKNDLTSVILIIPSGSAVSVLDSDSTYFYVLFEEAEGYIFRRHAKINNSPAKPAQVVQNQNQVYNEQPVQEQKVSRFSYLENKYGSTMAAKLLSGKIWKGMNSEMVEDSWGKAQNINRVISGNIIKEEWVYNSTWLYFENNSLREWGPIRK